MRLSSRLHNFVTRPFKSEIQNRSILSSRQTVFFSLQTILRQYKYAEAHLPRTTKSELSSIKDKPISVQSSIQHQSCMVPRPLPYPSTHPNKGIYGANTAHPSHFFATYPSQNFEILKRIYWKRRGYFMAVNLPSLPEVEQISTNIWRILGGNPSKFTLQGTNTYLLGNGKERILVDTAQGYDAWRDSLHGVLNDAGQDVQVKSCILTHWHHDHVMGIPDVKKHSPSVKIYKHQGNNYDPDGTLTQETIHEITDGQKFSIKVDSKSSNNKSTDATFEVQALHTPGHAKDHICLLITQSPDPTEIGSIFTADNVLGHGTAVFEDLATYISSLHLMKSRTGKSSTKGQSARAFPGHGAVIQDAQAKFDEYILHRKMREDEAMNVLVYGTTTQPGKAPLKTAEGFPQSQQGSATSSGDGVIDENSIGREWDSMDMVKIIYRMYPENLWEPAQGGLLQVLEKLKGDGKVAKSEDGKWRASEEVVRNAKEEIKSLSASTRGSGKL